LARQAGISPAFLSKIESGKEKPPAEQKVRALAKALRCNEEMLLASSGRLPRDVLKVIQKHPCEYFALVRTVKYLKAEELKVLQQELSLRRRS
jgi:transcriptional regulator with XRE-family HTH domain